MVDLKDDLRRALDPVPLASECGLDPDGWQRDVLRSSAPRMLLNCSRQSGKSTTTAVLAVHRAAYSPNSLVLLLSPALRQSQELFQKCAMVYKALAGTVPSKAESALRLELENGSRIVSLPGTEKTVRGYSGVDLLIIDEAARVEDELYYAVRPMLAVSGGRLVALSTPFGMRGWWYEAWRSSEAWERYEITASDCPRISPEFLEEERRTIGEWWFAQEFLCQFRDTVDQVFRSEDIDAALDNDEEPLFKQDRRIA